MFEPLMSQDEIDREPPKMTGTPLALTWLCMIGLSWAVPVGVVAGVIALVQAIGWSG